MVKRTKTNSAKNKMKIPIPTFVYWYKKLRKLIFDLQEKNEDVKNYKVYLSLRYPNISILELFLKIRKYLIKYVSENGIIKNKEENEDQDSTSTQSISPLKSIVIEIEVFENKECIEKLNTYKAMDKKEILSNKIRVRNIKKFADCKNFFKQPKFDKNFVKENNNLHMKYILIENEDSDDNFSEEKENEEETIEIKDDDEVIFPKKNELNQKTKDKKNEIYNQKEQVKKNDIMIEEINNKQKNKEKEKINNDYDIQKIKILSAPIQFRNRGTNSTIKRIETQFVTHFQRQPLTSSKYFKDDDYYNKIFSSYNNNNNYKINNSFSIQSWKKKFQTKYYKITK